MEKEFTRDSNPNFFILWDIKCVKPWNRKNNDLKDWYSYEIYAKTTKDIQINDHICKSGTKVRIWNISRFGDIGITDNLNDPKGYDIRGLDADIDLTDYEFIEKKN